MKHYQVMELAEGLLIVNGQTVGRRVVNCHWASDGNRAVKKEIVTEQT